MTTNFRAMQAWILISCTGPNVWFP